MMTNSVVYQVRGMDTRGGIVREYGIRDDGRKVITNIKEIEAQIKQRQREIEKQRKI